ncbi:MAG: glycosyltransferase family 4 protein [Verrucomicrobiota bacterium]
MLRRLYLDAALVALRPDLVHFEFGALAVDRMHLKELLGCKVVVSFRGYDMNLSGVEKRDYFQEIWAQADALHLLGEGLWKRAQERGCPSEKAHVLIPPAIDADSFAPDNGGSRTSVLDRPLRILSVGRLRWEKGHEYGIQALGLLQCRGVRCALQIVGDGPALEALAFVRHQLGQTEHVQFAGALPATRVREAMGGADVFLHPSVSEGFCNAVLEAQAMGLPVVCSDAGGLPENVVDGETGFVVPRRDANALAERLQRLALSPSLRAQMGEAGRRRVRSRFRIQDQITDFEKLYRSVASSQ